MASFGIRSENELGTCCSELQEILREAIKSWDFSVLKGARDKHTQDMLFFEGRSKVQYPNSKHNIFPSDAVDIAPYPVAWKDLGSFYLLIGYILRIAEEKEIKLRSGSDWDGDKKTADQTFHDLCHLEILR